MKRTYKNLFTFALGTLMSLSLAFTASAQHRTSGGGGGGGGAVRSSGGGGGGGFSRSSGGQSFSRPSFNGGAQRSAIAAPQRTYGTGSFGNRTSVTAAPQRTYGVGTRSNIAVAPGGQRTYGTANRTYSYGNRGYANVDRRAYAGGRGTYYNRAGYGNRVYSGYRYGGRGGYFGSHYYYPYRNYYSSYYLPRIGFSIGFLPYGYYPFWWGDYQYFYSDGLYYQQVNDQYTVVEPPVGAEIKNLPKDAQSIMINGEQYYESNGVYYQPITKDDGTATYVIAGKDGELNTDQGDAGYDQAPPRIGDMVNDLPQDTRKIKINGEKLYVSPDGYYYQETKDNSGNKAYKIVGTPADEPADQGQDQQ